MERKLNLIMEDQEKILKEISEQMIQEQLNSPIFNKQQPKRDRDKDGKFIADDPSTPDYNEAWVGGKAPENKENT